MTFRIQSLVFAVSFVSSLVASNGANWGRVEFHKTQEDIYSKQISLQKKSVRQNGEQLVLHAYTFKAPSSKREPASDIATFWPWKALPARLEVFHQQNGTVAKIHAVFSNKRSGQKDIIVKRFGRTSSIKTFEGAVLCSLLALGEIPSQINHEHPTINAETTSKESGLNTCSFLFQVKFPDGETRRFHSNSKGFTTIDKDGHVFPLTNYNVSNAREQLALSYWDIPGVPKSYGSQDREIPEGPRQRIWLHRHSLEEAPRVAIVTYLKNGTPVFGDDLETPRMHSTALQFVKASAIRNHIKALANIRRIATVPGGRRKDLDKIADTEAHLKNWEWEFTWEEQDTDFQGKIKDSPGKIRWEKSDDLKKREIGFTYKASTEEFSRKIAKYNTWVPKKVVLHLQKGSNRSKLYAMHIYLPEIDEISTPGETERRGMVQKCFGILEAIGYFEPKNSRHYEMKNGRPQPLLIHRLEILENCQVILHFGNSQKELISSEVFSEDAPLLPRKIKWKRLYCLDPEEHPLRFYFRGKAEWSTDDSRNDRITFLRGKDPIYKSWSVSEFRLPSVAKVAFYSNADIRTSSEISLRRTHPDEGYFARLHHTRLAEERQQFRDEMEKMGTTREKKPVISPELRKKMTSEQVEKVKNYCALIRTVKLMYMAENDLGSDDEVGWKQIEKELARALSDATLGKKTDVSDLETPLGGHYKLGEGFDKVRYVK